MKRACEFLKVGDKLVYCVINVNLKHGIKTTTNERQVRHVAGGVWKKEHPQNIAPATGCDIIVGDHSGKSADIHTLGEPVVLGGFKYSIKRMDRGLATFYCNPEDTEQAIKEYTNQMKKEMTELVDEMAEMTRQINNLNDKIN